MNNRRTRWLVLLVAAVVGCGGAADTATSAIGTSAIDPGNAGGRKIMSVMSRNLYIGADITPFLVGQGGDPAQIWADMQATNYPLRSGWLADEIVANQADVVGLQEVYRFVVTVLDANGQPIGSQTIDFLDILLAQLAARGYAYRVAVASSLISVTVPIDATTVVSLTDRDAIIVPVDAVTDDESAHVFQYLAPLPPFIPGLTEVPRGWVQADLKFRGEWVHLANSHLEIGGSPDLEMLQAAQASELLANLPADGPVVVTGDFNADAFQQKPAYQVLTSQLTDATAGLGASCCQAPLLDNTVSQLTERIDLILYRGPVTAEWARQTGAAPIGVEGGQPPYWASDHAGVAAGLRIWDRRFYALR
jgi:endonuclease/exonuclease/phosphatase family metal-dependent hydrolase